MKTTEIGKQGEQYAIQFLKEKNYAILTTHFIYNHGEIDIIAKEENEIVFVEVKTRRSKKFGKPEESVTPKKQELLRRTAEGYITQNNLTNISCRFDVIAISFHQQKIMYEHFKNAF